MDVSGKFVPVEFRLHNLRLVSALEQMSAFGVFTIHGQRVRGIERLHEFSEIPLMGLQMEMIMIRHETIRVNLDIEQIRIFRKFFKEKQIVIFSIEYLFSAVSPVDDMVTRPRIFNPQWSGHNTMPLNLKFFPITQRSQYAVSKGIQMHKHE